MHDGVLSVFQLSGFFLSLQRVVVLDKVTDFLLFLGKLLISGGLGEFFIVCCCCRVSVYSGPEFQITSGHIQDHDDDVKNNKCFKKNLFKQRLKKNLLTEDTTMHNNFCLKRSKNVIIQSLMYLFQLPICFPNFYFLHFCFWNFFFFFFFYLFSEFTLFLS